MAKPTIVAIASGKGGVGKSVVSANLALLLARQGRRVTLLDLDLGGADAHLLFGFADRRSREILDQVEDHARKKGLAQIRKVAKTGQPARTIVAHAKQIDADLIVLGSRGLGDIEGMLLGSVSHKVSTLAECSCLTVR